MTRVRRIAVPVLIGVLSSGAGTVIHAAPAHELVGLWNAVRNFGPEIAGPLTITQTPDGLRAFTAGLETMVNVTDTRLSFDIAGDRGRFVGAISADSSSIDGHWVQPMTIRSYAQMASPVHLNRIDAHRWRGDIVPLDNRMTMHLLLYEDSDGTVSGVLRNPEANFGRFFDIKDVQVGDEKISFRFRDQSSVRLQGEYYPEYDMFSLFFPDAGGTFDFRRADDSSSTFYPRSLNDPPYRYRIPGQENDGWDVGSLGDVGMAVEPIEELIRHVISTPMDAIDAPYIHAVLIARHGTLVLEEYFHGYDGRTPHGTRSASKSTTSTLAGMAIQAGLPVSLDTPVYGVMYDGQVPDTLDPRKRRMLLKHLLTMTPGWDCFDDDEESVGNEDRMQSQGNQPDWWQYSLDLPMVNEPGTVPGYCSGSFNLAGGVLTRATGMWLPELYQKYFAQPLNTGPYAMNLMPTGEAYGGGGLYICPRDFLKMGQIVLDSGRWHGEQVVSKEWASEAVSPQVSFSREDYGYGWWIISYPFSGREVQAFYAGGNGGQYIIGVPELDLNIVIFGANYGQSVMHKSKREYVPEYILKAIEQGKH